MRHDWQRRWWRLRRLIDRDLARNRLPVSFILPIVPLIAGMVARPVIGVSALLVGGVGAGIVAGWPGWRGWRLLRAMAIVGDRAYRSGRFALPPDYAGTESATAARQRRRAALRRVPRPRR